MIAEISFISLKRGSGETCITHMRSDKIEIMIGDDNDDIIEELFKSFKNMKSSQNLNEEIYKIK